MAGLDENKMYKVKELDVIDNKPLDCEGNLTLVSILWNMAWKCRMFMR